MKLANLKLNPDNPRNIQEEKLDKLAQSIKDFPKMMVKRPIVYDENKVIIGGNMRYRAIEKLGMSEIPDEWTSDASDFTEAERKRFIMQDNTEMGQHDWDMVANQYELEDLEAWGVDLPEALLTEDEVEEDEAPEVSSEPPKSKLGEVYQLGRHRLMCGDSTDFGSVSDLMDGKMADMVFTDPPYGIDVVSGTVGGSKPFGSVGASNTVKANQYSKIIGDDTTDTAKKHYDLCQTLGITKYLLWGGNYFTDFVPPKKCWIVWDKKGREWDDNFSDFEMAWTSMDKPAKIFTHTWMGMVQSGEREQRVHPTQKPAKLIADCLNYVEAGSVFDGFLGSGSTLIACEQTDRTCYGMELDEKYVDVVRKRYWKFINNGNEEGWQDATPPIA